MKKKHYNSRMSPLGLYDLIRCLNEIQRLAVKELGFGGLLFLETSILPVFLSWWLVSNYDPYSHTLKLKRGWLDITAEDVHLTLGFPLGRT